MKPSTLFDLGDVFDVKVFKYIHQFMIIVVDPRNFIIFYYLIEKRVDRLKNIKSLLWCNV